MARYDLIAADVQLEAELLNQQIMHMAEQIEKLKDQMKVRDRGRAAKELRELDEELSQW